MQIVYMTDGTLLRECIEDATLSKYKAVILDEAHIRSLDTVCGMYVMYVIVVMGWMFDERWFDEHSVPLTIT